MRVSSVLRCLLGIEQAVVERVFLESGGMFPACAGAAAALQRPLPEAMRQLTAAITERTGAGTAQMTAHRDRDCGHTTMQGRLTALDEHSCHQTHTCNTRTRKQQTRYRARTGRAGATCRRPRR